MKHRVGFVVHKTSMYLFDHFMKHRDWYTWNEFSHTDCILIAVPLKTCELFKELYDN